MTTSPLIYGKNPLERIVSIEVQDGDVEVFFEDPSGEVFSNVFPNEFYILAHAPLDQHFKPLKGNQHYRFIKTYSNRKSFTMDRFRWKERDIFSFWDSKESLMVREGYTYFKGMKHKEVSVLSFDIETTGLYHDKDARVLIISNTLRQKGQTIRKLFTYDQFEDEGKMIDAWCHWVREVDPSVMVGHNIYSYDLPYMEFIANKHETSLYLGRNNTPLVIDSFESKKRKESNQFHNYKKVHIYGREVIDTMFLAYDYGKRYESYGLKPIIAAEGLEVEGRTFYDASQIRKNYSNPIEWEKIKSYSLHDADDSLALYDLMSPPRFYLAQSVGRSFQHIVESATGGQINSIMNRAYLQEGHSVPKITPSKDFKGAISLGNPGIYSNVFKVDIASLYPSIILEYNLYDQEKDQNRHFLSLVDTFTQRRLKHKKLGKTEKYYDDLQAAEKIFINSCYGFLGSKYQNFNYPNGASFITAKGRELLEITLKWAKDKGYQIVNADTDSIAFNYPDGREIPNQQEILDEINALFPSKIRFEHDGYYAKVIVVKAKNYILYDGKTIKHKGSSLKASTKEVALKEFITEIIDAMVKGDYDFVKIYNKYVLEIYNLKDITRWGTRKTITDKVLSGTRSNETRVKTAINGYEYSEGDRAYVYFKDDGNLSLVENFQADHDKERLLSKLYLTSQIFSTVIDSQIFLNYSLKRNKALLESLTLNKV